MYYLDTSVLTGYYCAEERSQRVARVLSAMKGPSISPLVEVEFYCTVARKVRAGTMERSDAEMVFSRFQLHLAEPRFRILQIDSSEYALARNWIARLMTPVRALDAIHLAIASFNNLTLVTADKDLARSARHFGVKQKLIS